MAYDGISKTIDALAPNPARTNFPLPRVNSWTDSTGSYTSEGPIISGTQMPGQWLLTGAKREFGWQVVQGNYLQGARLVPTADPVVAVTYSIKIWSSADALVYRRMIRSGILSKPVLALKTPTNGLVAGADTSSAVLSIDDPSLGDVNITKVVLKSVTPLYNPLVTSAGKGPYTAEVSFWQWPGDFAAAAPIPDQSIQDPGAVTPDAYNAAMVAGAQVKQGDDQRQTLLAQQSLP